MATTQDEFKKEKGRKLFSAIKREWESLPSELTIRLVHSMNNRVIESHGDFILC